MSQYTKEHIVTKTIELAEKKPLTKITVKEIAQESGVTRNAFYYYFHDIFDVFTYYIDSHIQELIDGDRQKLKRAYDAIKAELQNYENNIGFLTAASKKGNSLIDQTQKKIESLKKDLEQIAQKLKES